MLPTTSRSLVIKGTKSHLLKIPFSSPLPLRNTNNANNCPSTTPPSFIISPITFHPPLTIAKRYTALWSARKKASDAATANANYGQNLMKGLARGQRWSSWAPDALVRLIGERKSQAGAKHQSAKANRHQWLHTYYTNVLRKQFHGKMRYRKRKLNWSEWWNYHPKTAALQPDTLGPDAIYKYKPTPHHVRFRNYAIHPRPIESNLTTGNEKVADKILPHDYMDKIFNQLDYSKSLSERYELIQYKLQYNIHTYRSMGIKQRILARIFHCAMPHHNEPLNLPNGTRRRFIGSNQIWVSGCWIDKREINDFFLALFFYPIGLPSIVIIKGKLEAERLQGHLIHEAGTFLPQPMEMRTRMIQDSDRTQKAQFEMIAPLPRMPLLD